MSSPAALATLLRYQSSWVLAQNGTATSFPFHVAPSHRRLDRVLGEAGDHRRAAPGPGTWPRRTRRRTRGRCSSGRCRSRLAASRRSSCWRWSLALLGSSCTRMAYLPPAASVHSLAIWACPFLVGSDPPPSGLMYHVRVGLPPAELSLVPQAATPGPTVALTARTAATALLLRIVALSAGVRRVHAASAGATSKAPGTEVRSLRSRPRRATGVHLRRDVRHPRQDGSSALARAPAASARWNGRKSPLRLWPSVPKPPPPGLARPGRRGAPRRTAPRRTAPPRQVRVTNPWETSQLSATSPGSCPSTSMRALRVTSVLSSSLRETAANRSAIWGWPSSPARGRSVPRCRRGRSGGRP